MAPVKRTRSPVVAKLSRSAVMVELGLVTYRAFSEAVLLTVPLTALISWAARDTLQVRGFSESGMLFSVVAEVSLS